MSNSARLLENKVETGVLRDVRGGIEDSVTIT